MKTLLILLAGASIIPLLPLPKTYPATMRVSYRTETNYTAQANGDLEDVRIKLIKRIDFSGTDPRPFMEEAATVSLSTNLTLVEIVTTRAVDRQPVLTRKQWEALQPPVLKP